VDSGVGEEAAALAGAASSGGRARRAVQEEEQVIDEALFPMEEKDLAKLEGIHIPESGNMNEILTHLRIRTDEYHQIFQQFMYNIGTRSASPDGVDSARSRANQATSRTGDFKMFIEAHEIHDDLKLIFRSIERIMGETPGALQDKAVRYQALAQLWMASVVGKVMESHGGLMDWKMKELMKQRWRRKLVEQNPTRYSPDNAKTQAVLNSKVDIQVAKVHFNCAQLGRFLRLGSFGMFSAVQQILMQTATKVRKYMAGKMQKQICVFPEHGVVPVIETKLTIDLYESHYDLNNHFVSMSTSELLYLSNLLTIYKDDIILITEGRKDRLVEVVEMIQPSDTLLDGVPRESGDDEEGLHSGGVGAEEGHQSGGGGADATVPLGRKLWPQWVLQFLGREQVRHNFSIKSRFLESERELVFCRECEAPCPRSMSTQAQQGRSGTRLIKVFLPFKGPQLDNHYPFYELEEFIASSELEKLCLKLTKKEWLLQRYELEEAQKQISQDLQKKNPTQDRGKAEDFAIIAKIENATTNIDIMRNYNKTEAEFREFVKKNMQLRRDHYQYLRSLDKQKELEACKRRYQADLERRIKQLQKVCEISEDAKLPMILATRATDAVPSTTLSMTRVEHKVRSQKKKMEDQSDRTSVYMYPTGTYSLAWLRAKRVVAWLDVHTKKEHKHLLLRFSSAASGDWDVKVLHKSGPSGEHMILSFKIEAGLIDTMKHGGKTAKIPFGVDASRPDGFLTMNAFNLVQLLARITAERSHVYRQGSTE